MSPIIIYTVIALTSLGIVAAAILFFVAKKFYVKENPKIDEVEEALPATNCGGCGQPGCRAFAEACVNAEDLSDLFCPVGGNETMQNVAKILGLEVEEREPYIAVVRCNGSFEHRPRTSNYEGAPNCTIAANLYGGETGCTYGCLGLGECVDACDFDAMYMDETTGLPVVIPDKCTACNACVTACPKNIIELRPKGKRDRRIFVSCINEDRGGKRDCEVGCTGCTACEKECKFGAISFIRHLAYIDPEKCRLCRKCVDVCKPGSIHEINFPPKKKKPPKEKVAAKEKQIEKLEAEVENPNVDKLVVEKKNIDVLKKSSGISDDKDE
ncbi:MAG TPA: ferredoxin [Cytophagales bacterium]|jgi:electron transport complex protein RnfB|nr:ferredoxin [Cytophagales bacterium]